MKMSKQVSFFFCFTTTLAILLLSHLIINPEVTVSDPELLYSAELYLDAWSDSTAFGRRNRGCANFCPCHIAAVRLVVILCCFINSWHLCECAGTVDYICVIAFII